MATQYPSPMASLPSYIDASIPLSSERNADRSMVNPKQDTLSPAYQTFPAPIRSPDKGNAFDFHIYYFQEDEYEKKYAKELYERIRREFPGE